MKGATPLLDHPSRVRELLSPQVEVYVNSTLTICSCFSWVGKALKGQSRKRGNLGFQIKNYIVGSVFQEDSSSTSPTGTESSPVR